MKTGITKAGRDMAAQGSVMGFVAKEQFAHFTTRKSRLSMVSSQTSGQLNEALKRKRRFRFTLSNHKTKLSVSLTHNRRSFYLLGEHSLREQCRDGLPVTVLYFDMDGLKEINDRLGHEVGSRLVVDFANLLRTNFHGSDLVARVGGDEFAVVTRNTPTEWSPHYDA